MKRRIANKILDLDDPPHRNSTLRRVGRVADMCSGTLRKQKKWGLYDSYDDLWIGDSKAPMTYANKTIASISARLIGIRLKWSPLRIVVKRYKPAWKKFDDIKPEFTMEQAMIMLEQGIVL